MEPLARLKCRPVQAGESTLSPAAVAELAVQVPDWQVIKREGVQQLERSFEFKNFAQALAFTNAVGRLAEAENHHPAILTEWGRVTLTLWTHKVSGLHMNDFVLAAKVDRLPAPE